MSDERSGGTQYYMTSEFQDILVAQKFRDKNSILGGGSPDFDRSMHLLGAAKSLYGYQSAFDVSREFNEPDKRDHEVNQRYQRFMGLGRGGSPKPIDLQVVSAALQDPDPDKGIWERVLITNDPNLKKLVSELGGKTLGVEEFGQRALSEGLIGKPEMDLLKRSTTEQNKKLSKEGSSFDVSRAITQEKQLRLQQRREMRREHVIGRPSVEEMSKVSKDIQQKQEMRDRRKARKFSKDDLSGMS